MNFNNIQAIVWSLIIPKNNLSILSTTLAHVKLPQPMNTTSKCALTNAESFLSIRNGIDRFMNSNDQCGSIHPSLCPRK